jgi:hypothetical protein
MGPCVDRTAAAVEPSRPRPERSASLGDTAPARVTYPPQAYGPTVALRATKTAQRMRPNRPPTHPLIVQYAKNPRWPSHTPSTKAASRQLLVNNGARRLALTFQDGPPALASLLLPQRFLEAPRVSSRCQKLRSSMS